VLMREGQVVLDDTWAALDEGQLATLDEVVGLPLALRAAKTLGPTADAELRELLLSTAQAPQNADSQN